MVGDNIDRYHKVVHDQTELHVMRRLHRVSVVAALFIGKYDPAMA